MTGYALYHITDGEDWEAVVILPIGEDIEKYLDPGVRVARIVYLTDVDLSSFPCARCLVEE